jgi:hypothetical protein
MWQGKYMPLKNWEVHYGVIHNPAIYSGSGDSVVDTETRLQDGRSRIRIMVEKRDFSLFQNIQAGSVADASSFSVRICILSQV